MSTCQKSECRLGQYKDNNECIIHCKKSLDSSHYSNFIPERNSFYKALEQIIEENKNDKYCYLSYIHFPRPDTQGRNYEALLNSLVGIHFDYCEFYGQKLDLKNNVSFQNCTFHNDWVLQNYAMHNNIDNTLYNYCNFKKPVTFNSFNDVKNNKISNSQFNYGCTFEDDIMINNATIDKNIFNDNQGNYLDSNFDKKIEFNKCNFKGNQEFYLSNNKNAEMSFSHCSFGRKFKIRNIDKGNYEEQQKNKARLKKLSIIDCTAKTNSYLRIGFLNIDTFVLSNLKLPDYTELNIGDCHFCDFKLTNFRNIGKFKLYKINILKEKNENSNHNIEKFQIDNTSIGKTDFQSLNLSSFKKVIMFDNIFTEIDYTNVRWKRTIEVGQYDDSKNIKLAKLRDTYRTLKNVAIRNNDHPQALIFYNLEIKNHYNITKFKKEPLNKLILVFNKCTNNFGSNWLYPILLIIGLSFIFYIALLCSLDMYNSQLCVDENRKNIYSNYFVFLNPIHNVKFILAEHWSIWTYCFDFIFKILESLLIYQTNQAFRKYSKTIS